MTQSARKIRSLVLLAALALPALPARAGGSFSACRRNKVLPRAAAFALVFTWLAWEATRARVPDRQVGGSADPGRSGGAGGAGAAAAALAAAPAGGTTARAAGEPLAGLAQARGTGATAPAGAPAGLVTAGGAGAVPADRRTTAWSRRHKSQPTLETEVRTPGALDRHRAQPVEALVRAAQRSYPPEGAAGTQPERPGTRWLGREVARKFPRDRVPSDFSAERQAALREEIRAMAVAGGFDAHRNSTRELVQDFDGAVAAALRAHQASTAPGRDLRLAGDLLQARRIKIQELDAAARYYDDVLELLTPDWNDLEDGRWDERTATRDRYHDGLAACWQELDAAAERYLHHCLPLILRLIPLDSPDLDDIKEELFLEGLAIPYHLEHVADQEPGAGLEDKL